MMSVAQTEKPDNECQVFLSYVGYGYGKVFSLCKDHVRVETYGSDVWEEGIDPLFLPSREPRNTYKITSMKQLRDELMNIVETIDDIVIVPPSDIDLLDNDFHREFIKVYREAYDKHKRYLEYYEADLMAEGDYYDD